VCGPSLLTPALLETERPAYPTVVEPLMTALLIAGSTNVFKALVNGGGVDQKDISEIATAMLQAP
jgi:hypothetical protein